MLTRHGPGEPADQGCERLARTTRGTHARATPPASGRAERIVLDLSAAGAAVGRDRGLATYAAEKRASGRPRTALNTLVRRG